MENDNKEKKLLQTIVYKQVYSKKLSPERLELLKHRGVSACPQCGSEALRSVENGETVCLRCGYHTRVLR